MIYFLRHAETDANAGHRLAGGGQDLLLNANGLAQAQGLLTQSWPNLQGITSSPMKRALATVAPLAQHLSIEVGVDAGFAEWKLGAWEGQPYDGYLQRILGERSIASAADNPPGGETREEFYQRVAVAWNRVILKAQPHLIVSHGAVWMALQDLLGLERHRLGNVELVAIPPKSV